MKKVHALLWLAPALFAVGCSKEAVVAGTAVESAKAAPIALTGRYQGEMEMAAGDSNDPAAAMAKGFGSMLGAMMELEIKDKERFKMSVMGMPVEGKYTLVGDKITMEAETFMGMTQEELKKQGQMNPNFSKEKLTGTIEKGGEVIRLTSGKANEGTMVFRRKKEEPAKPVVDKVASADRPLVGTWKAEIKEPEGAMTAAEQQETKLAKAMLSTSKLRLRADYTFSLTMVFELEGTWKTESGQLVLNPTKVMGMDASGGSSKEPMKLSMEGNRLVMKDGSAGKSQLVFTKE